MDDRTTDDVASPFRDGELYDVLCGGQTYGIDFHVELARTARPGAGHLLRHQARDLAVPARRR